MCTCPQEIIQVSLKAADFSLIPDDFYFQNPLQSTIIRWLQLILFKHVCFAKQSSTKPNINLTFPYDAIFFQSLIFIEQFNWILSIRLFASLVLECKHYIQLFVSVPNFSHSPHMYVLRFLSLATIRHY